MNACQIQDCPRPAATRGWCDSHYRRWLRTGDPTSGSRIIPRKVSPEATFAESTEPKGDHVLWTGAMDNHGYGVVAVYGKSVRAHRYAWERVNGPIPEGMFVDHVCFVPACVRVEHLRIASPADNNRYRQGPNRQNRLGIRNVRRHGTGYEVRVTFKRVVYGGWHKTLESAEQEAQALRAELFGEFAGPKHRKTFATVEEADEWARMKRQELFGEFAGRG